MRRRRSCSRRTSSAAVSRGPMRPRARSSRVSRARIRSLAANAAAARPRLRSMSASCAYTSHLSARKAARRSATASDWLGRSISAMAPYNSPAASSSACWLRRASASPARSCHRTPGAARSPSCVSPNRYSTSAAAGRPAAASRSARSPMAAAAATGSPSRSSSAAASASTRRATAVSPERRAMRPSITPVSAAPRRCPAARCVCSAVSSNAVAPLRSSRSSRRNA